MGRERIETHQPHGLPNDKDNRLVRNRPGVREEEEGERDVEERDGRQDRAGGYQRHGLLLCGLGRLSPLFPLRLLFRQGIRRERVLRWELGFEVRGCRVFAWLRFQLRDFEVGF